MVAKTFGVCFAHVYHAAAQGFIVKNLMYGLCHGFIVVWINIY